MPEEKKLSRREFLKAAGLVGLGGTVTALSGWHLAKELGLRPEQIVKENGKRLLEQLDWYWREVKSLRREQRSSHVVEGREKATPTRKPEETPVASEDAMEELTSVEKEERNEFAFGEIDFSDPSQPIEMLITTNSQDKLLIPSFSSHAWSPEVDQKNVFDPENNTGVVWQDEGKRIGLWLHSGRAGKLHEGYTMWGVQTYIEESAQGNRRPYWETEKVLEEQIRGADILIKQGDKSTLARITAAVRIPPERVIDSTKHVMDMVPYLAKNYQGKGFEELVNKDKVLLPKFCGRFLAGEKENPELPSYQQARFIFGIEQA